MTTLRICSGAGLALVLCLTLPSCANRQEPASGPRATEPASPQGTEGIAETELANEYEFEPYPGSRWYGPDGNVISQDKNIINAITGPDHCDWQSAVMMHVGWPLGHDADDASESRQYLRDPEGVFPQTALMTSFEPNVQLPRGARYTGYRTDFMELCLDRDDNTSAYLVFADHVEGWPRAGEVIACA